jgi:hypothetical protein
MVEQIRALLLRLDRLGKVKARTQARRNVAAGSGFLIIALIFRPSLQPIANFNIGLWLSILTARPD